MNVNPIIYQIMNLPQEERHLIMCVLLQDPDYLIPFLKSKEELDEWIKYCEGINHEMTDAEFESFLYWFRKYGGMEELNDKFYDMFMDWMKENSPEFRRKRIVKNLIETV